VGVKREPERWGKGNEERREGTPLLFIVRVWVHAARGLTFPFRSHPVPFAAESVPTGARGRRDGVRSLPFRFWCVSFRVLSSFTAGRGLGVSGLALAAAKLTRARPYLTPCSADGFNINNKFIKGECMERSSSR
jgi:hypothetical protein